jgi:hypothetical protein
VHRHLTAAAAGQNVARAYGFILVWGSLTLTGIVPICLPDLNSYSKNSRLYYSNSPLASGGAPCAWLGSQSKPLCAKGHPSPEVGARTRAPVAGETWASPWFSSQRNFPNLGNGGSHVEFLPANPQPDLLGSEGGGLGPPAAKLCIIFLSKTVTFPAKQGGTPGCAQTHVFLNSPS